MYDTIQVENIFLLKKFVKYMSCLFKYLVLERKFNFWYRLYDGY